MRTVGLIGTLAEFVSGLDAATLPARVIEHTKMHILDAIGAMLAGPQTAEGIAITGLCETLDEPSARPVLGHGIKTSLARAIFAECAAARCTEIDDIHLESCTTPGSVVVPTALSLASSGDIKNGSDLITAVVAGYELMIRMGLAVEGPRVLYEGIWPTYTSTPVAAAATTARALKLDGAVTAHALAIALTMTSGVSGRIRTGLSSRWITLGAAAESGFMAAFAANNGFAGDEAVLDRDSGPMASLLTAKARLVKDLGSEFLIGNTSLKPYPSARQALSGIEVFRGILSTHDIEPRTIDEVVVRVPGSFVGMIGNADLPMSRLESIVGLQYQMALAAFYPEVLFDVNREFLPDDQEIIDFMKKVRVRRSEELEKEYPRIWPARVEVRCGSNTYASEMLRLIWDSAEELGWEEIEAKFGRVAGPIVGKELAGHLVESVRNLDTLENVAGLVDLLS
ncbi:MAG: 2-methylcitrate dehydratase family protein [Deltaproteobacteria bacterium]|nr:2-methylcitrate dehydratase family protein [Deltaproteobacteria bacterium]